MGCSLVDVIAVKVLDEYKLYLNFSDGAQGTVDVAALVPSKGVFEPLVDVAFFARVSLNSDIGTICWENGADLSPAYLRQHLQGG